MASSGPPNVVTSVVTKVQEFFQGGAPDFVKEADEFYIASLNEQKAYHRIWYRNIAFLMGLQWLDWSDGKNWMIDPPAPSWRVKMVTNLIQPMVRTEAAKILKTNPQIKVVPAGSDQDQRDAARAGDRLMEAKYYEDAFQRKLYTLVMWMLTCGSSFMWSLWDPTKGRYVGDGPDGRSIMEGEAIDDICGPFETMLEPGGSEDFNEHSTIMRVKVRTVDYIKDKYGIEVKPEDTKAETLYQQRISQLVSFNGEAVIPVRQYLEKVAIVKEYFKLPCSKYKNGVHFSYAGGKVLVEPDDLDYFYGDIRALPTSKFDHITIPGRAYAMSIIEQLAPIQVILNKMDSAVVENANQLSRPKIIAPINCLDADVWTTEPGEIVEYTPIGGGKPEAMKPPEMPQYFFQMKDSLPQKMQDIAGIQDVGLGKLPRRATSGKAIDLLQDADDSRMGLTIKNFGSSLERIQSIKLDLMGRKYQESRIVRKLGKSHEIEIFKFCGADLKGANTVRCVIGAALSRTAKIQIGLKLAENNMIPKDMALKIMELGDLNLAFDKDQDQTQYAQYENFGMQKGILYPVGELEPHQVHIQAHREFLLNPNYKNLPPQIKQIFTEHINQHAALAASAMTGQPAPPPGAPGQMPGHPGPISPQGEGAPTQQAGSA